MGIDTDELTSEEFLQLMSGAINLVFGRVNLGTAVQLLLASLLLTITMSFGTFN